MGILTVDRNLSPCSSSSPSSPPLASPARNQCPTLQQIGEAFEQEFNVEIPDGILDCVHGGNNCPFSSFQDFFQWFEESTGLEIPDVDVDVEDLVDACMSGSEDCPTLQEAVDFVQTELGANLDDQTVQTIFNCAEDVLAQLGFN